MGKMKRLVALVILIIPGILAGYGFKLLRETFFGILNSPFPSLPLQLAGGLTAFTAGVGFIGGFIFHRDRKRNKVQARFKPSARTKKQHH